MQLRLPAGGQKSLVKSFKKSGARHNLGEIKSTLDLVLEKTRDLTLSEEEKLSLARKELDKNVRGLLNRYLENFLPLKRLNQEMENIASNERDLAYKLLKKHLLAHFDLDSDNSSILSALSEVAGFDITPLTILHKKYHSEKEETERAFKERILKALKGRGVSGSAVVPNLNHIPDWDQFLDSSHKRYQERIKSIANG